MLNRVQVDSATDADCTEVEGDPPSTQVSPQALPRAAKASKAAMKKAAAAAAPGIVISQLNPEIF